MKTNNTGLRKILALGLSGMVMGLVGCGNCATNAQNQGGEVIPTGSRPFQEYIVPKLQLNLNGTPCTPLDSVWQRELINFMIGPEKLMDNDCQFLNGLQLLAVRKGDILEATYKLGSCCAERHRERIPDQKRKLLFEMLQKVPCVQELPSDTLNFTTSGIVIAVVSDIDTELVTE